MKKKKVKEKLYEIRKAIIEEIEEPEEGTEILIQKYEKGFMRYGYRVGMSRAAMILLYKIYEMFPEEEEENE